MSEHERTSTIAAPTAPADGADGRRVPAHARAHAPSARASGAAAGGRKRFKVRKLRVLLVLFFLGVLAIVSALFGMFMAVASDLPPLEAPAHAAVGDRRHPRHARSAR